MAEAARESKRLLGLALACQGCALLGLTVGTALGASRPLSLWLLVLGGTILVMGAMLRPVRPTVSNFITLTGFTLSVAAAAVILTTAFSR